MARPAQPDTGTIGTGTMRLRAELAAQHGHEAIFSCRAGTRHGDEHDGPSVPCQPAARHHYCTSSKSKFHKDVNNIIFKLGDSLTVGRK
jgi:hypothetical protein